MLRNIEFLPVETTIVGFMCQFISIGAMMVTKLVLISNLLIYAPYTYPIGMLLELVIILPCAWFLKSKNYVNASARSRYLKLKHSTSFNLQNINLSLIKPDKLVLLMTKFEILEQNSSLIYVRTQQFETR